MRHEVMQIIQPCIVNKSISNQICTFGFDSFTLATGAKGPCLVAVGKCFAVWMYCLSFLSPGTSIVHFSVQKLISKDQIMKTTNFNIPDRTKFPPAVNETGLVSIYFESL
jgi:hypothetical protein